MKKLPITDATDEQIKAFATNVLQIANVPATRGPLLAALVEAGHSADYILIDTDETADDGDFIAQHEEPSEKVHEMPTAGFGYWRESPMVKLRISPTDRPGGNEPAHPSINGSPPLVIQRNILVRIPYDFYMVLLQAGGTKLIPGEKPTDELVRVNYLEYPLQDVELPPRAEIAAWMARSEKNELGRARAA